MHKQQTNYSFFFSEAIFKQHSVNWKYIFPTLLSCFNVWSSLSWVYHVSRPIMIIVTQHKPDKAPGGLDTWWWQLTPDGGHLLTSCHSLQIYKSRKFRRHLDSRARRSASPDARVSLCHHWCHMSQSLSCTSSSLKLATVPLCLMWDWVTVFTGHRPVSDCAQCPADQPWPGRATLGCVHQPRALGDRPRAAITLWPRA